VSGEFFPNTAIGTRITGKSMVDNNATQKFLDEKNLHFFPFYTKEGKPLKAVIRHLPGNSSAEDTIVALQKIDYDDISVKQMTSKRSSPEGAGGPSYSSKGPRSSRNVQKDNTL
jgi:hypothetical protein